MNAHRLVFLVAVGGALLRFVPLEADDTAAPFAMEKHYSADLTITLKSGMVIATKAYVDGDKMRSDVTMNGMGMSIIVRKDTKEIYQILSSQKMMMETPFDATKFKGRAAASFGPEGKFDLIGPDTVDGVACTKYKVTSDADQQVFYFWLDSARKVPVRMVPQDGSLTVSWKNFAAGPQDAALFEPPAGYQIMPMPGIPAAAAGAGGAP
jgi:hypothetical protein